MTSTAKRTVVTLVIAALLGFVVLIFSCGGYCSYLLLRFLHAGLGSLGCRGSSSLCAVAGPAIDCTPVGCWLCRSRPVFWFAAIAIFVRRLVAMVVGSSGLRHSCAAAVEVVSGGPSDGPVVVALGGDGRATPVVCSATNRCCCRAY
jgi:hypothetical protein